MLTAAARRQADVGKLELRPQAARLHAASDSIVQQRGLTLSGSAALRQPSCRLLPRPASAPYCCPADSAVPGLRYRLCCSAPDTPSCWSWAAGGARAVLGLLGAALPPYAKSLGSDLRRPWPQTLCSGVRGDVLVGGCKLFLGPAGLCLASTRTALRQHCWVASPGRDMCKAVASAAAR